MTDIDTAATIRQMVRYITDDRYIAQYVGATEAEVRGIRNTGRKKANPRPDHPVQRNCIDGREYVASDHWHDAARKGTQRLAAAIRTQPMRMRRKPTRDPAEIIAELDALSRKRALTLAESLELEHAIQFEGVGARKHYFWSPDEDAKLLRLRADGVTFVQIAKIIGRSQRSCEHRAGVLRKGGSVNLERAA